MHKVHGKFRQIWEPEMVDMTILRENTEGLYHSLLKRASNRAQGLPEYTIPSGFSRPSREVDTIQDQFHHTEPTFGEDGF